MDDFKAFLFILIFGGIPAYMMLRYAKRTENPRKRRDDLLDDNED